MDRSEVLTLITEELYQDALLIQRTRETKRDIFCAAESVTASEFFEGGRNGLNPEFRFVIFFGDYNGERIVEYKGQRYAIYRTYHAKTDTLELYAERKGGTNAEPPTPPTPGDDNGQESDD